MDSYFISPKEKTDLHIDTAQFAAQLARDWPDANYHFVEDGKGPYGLRWTLKMPYGPIEGALDRAGQTVVVDGDVQNAARFARWVRQEVPKRYALLFYDEGYSADVELTDDTSIDDLVRPFLA
jgi:hypothetical protein